MTEKRAKELQLDAKWEAAIDVSLRRIVYGAIGGTTLAMLMCRGTTARTAVAAMRKEERGANMLDIVVCFLLIDWRPNGKMALCFLVTTY